MKDSIKALATLALATAWAGAAVAATPQFEFGGYFRSGGGTSDKGGKEVCFRAPGSIVWFRLGNECDTYGALNFGANLGQVDGTTFKTMVTMAYGTQQLANWEQSTPAWRQVYVEAQDIGASMDMPWLRGASLWAGKRFYKNPDVHMLDYTYWEPAQGPGFGLDNIATSNGKISYALFRIGDFAGYGDPGNTGFNPGILNGGDRTSTVHDLRWQDIEVNPGGKLTAGVDLIVKNNHDGVPGQNGLGLTVSHVQEDLLHLGGSHNVVVQYAKNAAALKGFGFAGAVNKRDEWLLFNHWVMEPKGSNLSGVFTAGYRHAKETSATSGTETATKDLWIGARPQYNLNNVWSLMSEVGYQQVTVGDGDPRKLAKLTLGTQFSMGRSVWARPSIRFYTTYAKWNDAAAAAGSVVCTGRDCGTPVDVYADKRNGLSYGVQGRSLVVSQAAAAVAAVLARGGLAPSQVRWARRTP